MKYLFYIINLMLVAAIAYFFVEITYKKLFPGYMAPFEFSFSKTASQEIKSGKIKNRQKKHSPAAGIELGRGASKAHVVRAKQTKGVLLFS